jgi:Fe-Mn family superoxide dismutase
MIQFPELPYAEDALEPHMSKVVISYHYGKHTKKYYDTLNSLIKGTAFDDVDTLEQLVSKKTLQTGDSALFNNAAQAWNHTFFWQCLSPINDAGEVSPDLERELEREFGSFERFKETVTEKATKHFASGWCWVILKNGKIMVKSTPNANTPLTSDGEVPLFTIDLWEHSHYLQYPADRPAYIKAIWSILNWNFINDNFKKATKRK